MAAFHSQIVERASDFHRQIRKAFFGVAKNIFDDPATLDTSNGISKVLSVNQPELLDQYKNLYTYGKNTEHAGELYLRTIFDFLMNNCLKNLDLTIIQK